MTSRWRSGWDLLAALAALIVLFMMGVYVGVIRQQGGEIAVWFLAGLGVAVLLAIYGAVRTAPWRAVALAVSGAVMGALGLLGILSVGLPIIVAGVVALVAAGRAAAAPRSAS